jgi:hypothetical protein
VRVLGAILIIVAMAFVFPPLVFAGGLVLSALLGWASKEEAEATHEGSEFIELNR